MPVVHKKCIVGIENTTHTKAPHFGGGLVVSNHVFIVSTFGEDDPFWLHRR